MKKVRGANNNKSDEEHALIRKLYTAMASVRQIVQITGFAPNTVQRHIMMVRDYIRCEHGSRLYECKACRVTNNVRRRTLEHIKRDAGIADGA